MCCTLSCRGLSYNFILYAGCTPCSLFFVGHCTLSMWCIRHHRGLSSCFLFTCREYSLQFVFLLDFVLRSCGILHVTLFECVQAVYKEAFSVNFIVDRFSLPYLFYVICVFYIILFYFIYLLIFSFLMSYWVSFSHMDNTFWNSLILPSFFCLLYF